MLCRCIFLNYLSKKTNIIDYSGHFIFRSVHKLFIRMRYTYYVKHLVNNYTLKIHCFSIEKKCETKTISALHIF